MSTRIPLLIRSLFNNISVCNTVPYNIINTEQNSKKMGWIKLKFTSTQYRAYYKRSRELEAAKGLGSVALWGGNYGSQFFLEETRGFECACNIAICEAILPQLAEAFFAETWGKGLFGDGTHAMESLHWKQASANGDVFPPLAENFFSHEGLWGPLVPIVACLVALLVYFRDSQHGALHILLDYTSQQPQQPWMVVRDGGSCCPSIFGGTMLATPVLLHWF